MKQFIIPAVCAIACVSAATAVQAQGPYSSKLYYNPPSRYIHVERPVEPIRRDHNHVDAIRDMGFCGPIATTSTVSMTGNVPGVMLAAKCASPSVVLVDAPAGCTSIPVAATTTNTAGKSGTTNGNTVRSIRPADTANTIAMTSVLLATTRHEPATPSIWVTAACESDSTSPGNPTALQAEQD